MRYNVILCCLATLIFSVFLSVVPAFASVDVGVDVPPNPTDISYDDRLTEIYGSTVYDGSHYYASYVASNKASEIYGSFINISGVNKLFRTYVYIPITDNSYLWSNFSVGYSNSNNFSNVAWGSVRDSSYEYKTIVTIDNVQYLSIYTNTLLPNDFSFSGIEYFNDGVQLLDSEWSDLTETQIFEMCKNFDHPQLIGEYDASIPCLVRADVSFSNITIRQTDGINGLQPLTQAGQITGVLSPITNQGFLTSDYYVDYQVFFGISTCRTIPINEVIGTDFVSFTKYNGGLDLSLFNQKSVDYVTDKYAVGKFFEGPNRLKVSCNTISVNVRLRRKSDGNFGDWYSFGVNNLGYNDSSYHIDYDGNYKPLSQGYSGIVSGSTQTILPTADFDDGLTVQNAPSTSITANDVSLGTSENGGVLQQGGVIDLVSANGDVNYDNILSYLGEVPKLFGVVFGYLPPFFISFITTALILLVSIGLIKMLI